jgi:glutamine amidotransferase PdxT
MSRPLVGVLALQGAFEEHQKCLEAVGCRTRQVSTIALSILDVQLERSGTL